MTPKNDDHDFNEGPRIGDKPIEPKFRQVMLDIARALDRTLNGDLKGTERTVGFCLMVFNFGDEGRANYVSNADRGDVVTMLEEQLARLKNSWRLKSNGDG